MTGSIAAGTFLTPKHDPNGVVTFSQSRSVLSHPVSASLDALIPSGAFQLDHYSNSRYPNGEGVYVLTLQDSGSFPIAGSGILTYTNNPSGPLDRLIVVSGSVIGWHIYSENSSEIQNIKDRGQYTLIGSY